jgi:hypothetical protein
MTTRAFPRRAAARTALPHGDRRHRVGLGLLALLLAGCTQDFVPGSVIENRRVLALVADPPELDGTQPGAATTVRAVEAQPLDQAEPPGTTLERRWSLCPFSLGARAGYACALPQCEVPLVPDAGGAVTVAQADLLALVTTCLQAPGTVPPPGLGDGTFPAVSDVLVRYRLVEVTPAAAVPEVLLREAVQRIPVWNQPPTRALNGQPAFAAVAVEVDGVAAQPCADPTAAGVATCAAAGTLTPLAPLSIVAHVDPATIEDYPTGDRIATEAFNLTFFTTAGRFDYEAASATRDQPSGGVKLKFEAVPETTRDALLWVALRDLRGGEAVAGPFRLAVAP